MSQALYKFLRKAQLAAEPGAEELMKSVRAQSRYLIIKRLAEIGSEHKGMTGPIGPDARNMLLKAEREMMEAPQPQVEGPLWQGTVERWGDWYNGRRRKE